ncbi:MAG: zinc-binding alcohol dehydrogenase family protein [Rhodothermales bacterium]
MNTLVLKEPGQFAFENRPALVEPAQGDVRVRVRRIGVCGTDLHAFKGDQPFFNYPRVLGHELGVEVLSLGSESSGLQVGDYCAIEPYLNCGVCVPCKSGKTNCCEKLLVLGVHEDGGMTEEMIVPAAKLHKSASLPLEHLALVEMLSIGAHAVSRAKLEIQDKVLVVGAGPIGLSVIQFAKLAGVEPVVFEMDETRRAFCSSFLGIDACVAPAENPMDQLRELMHGALPDVVFDATGNSTSMHRSFELIGAGGTLVFVGLILGDISFYNPEFHRKELTLKSSRNATSSDFDYVVRMLESGKINITPWITHRTNFNNTLNEFPSWLKREEGVVKAMIDLD